MIIAFLGQKLAMGSFLDYLPTIDGHQAVAFADRGKPVRDYKNCPPRLYFAQAGADDSLRLIVKGRRGFIKDDDAGG